MVTPILMLGAGRMGGAMLAGWRKSQAFTPAELMIRDPHPGEAALAAAGDGAVLNAPDTDLSKARTVVLAVKPQIWRDAAAEISPLLAPDAVVVSIVVGVAAADISKAFGGRRVSRVMPTTAAAICQGTASLFSGDAEALGRARALFEPLGAVVDLADEGLMHAATGVSGSAPAYLYAFVEALEAAGVAAGLTAPESARLARTTITGAAALLLQSGEEPAELRRQVTSPGGTTQAALEVLMAEEGLPALLREAVAACVRRARELAV